MDRKNKLKEWLLIDYELTKCLSSKRLTACWNKHNPNDIITQKELVEVWDNMIK